MRIRTVWTSLQIKLVTSLLLLLVHPAAAIPQIPSNDEPVIDIRAIVFSPDGRMLALVRGELRPAKHVWDDYDRHVAFESYQSEVEIWNVAENRLTRKLGDYAGPIFLSTFSPDGNSLATMSWEPLVAKPVTLAVARAGIERQHYFSEVEIWNLQTGKLTRTLMFYTAPLAAKDLRSVTMPWNPLRQYIIYQLRAKSRPITSLAFSLDGLRLIGSDSVVAVKTWDLATGKVILNGVSKKPVTAAGLSFHGDTLAMADQDNKVRLWQVETGALLTALSPSQVAKAIDADRFFVSAEQISSVAFYPDGKTIASAGTDSVVRLWDAQSGTIRLKLTGHEHAVLALAVSADAAVLASAGEDGIIKVWNARTGSLDRTILGSGAPINSVAFSPDGKLIAAGSEDSSVMLCGLQGGQTTLKLNRHTGAVNTVAFSPDGTLLISAGADRTIRLWDLKTGSLALEWQAHLAPIRVIAISSDGQLASGSIDGTVRVWETLTGKLIRTLNGHVGPVSFIAFSPDGRLIATCGADKVVTLTDPRTGELTRTLRGHGGPVSSLAFSPDNKTLVAGVGIDTLALWDCHTGDLKRVLRESKWIPVNMR